MIETITRAEQVELSNYIENIKRMKSLSDNLDEKYYDEKVATYALNAHIDIKKSAQASGIYPIGYRTKII